MRITAATRSREDIIKERDNYDEAARKAENQQEEDTQRYRSALYTVTQGIQAIVEDKLATVMKPLNLTVEVRRGWSDRLEVTVNSNQNNRNSETTALSWNWSVQLNEETGKIAKDSGSWSGLNATTETQIESLRQSVVAFEILNGMDWGNVLNVELPKYQDYFQPHGYNRLDRPNFEQELMESDIEDIIGTNKLVEGNQGKYYRSYVYFGVVSQTAQQYTVYEVAKGYIHDADEVKQASSYTYRLTKDKFLSKLVKPLNIIEGGK